MHPMDEWALLQDVPLQKYDNQNNLKISRSRLTFIGYDNAKLLLSRGLKSGEVRLKLADRFGNNRKWFWVWEKFSKEERVRIAQWLLSGISTDEIRTIAYKQEDEE